MILKLVSVEAKEEVKMVPAFPGHLNTLYNDQHDHDDDDDDEDEGRKYGTDLSRTPDNLLVLDSSGVCSIYWVFQLWTNFFAFKY